MIKLYASILAVLLLPSAVLAQQPVSTASLDLPDAPQPTVQQQSAPPPTQIPAPSSTRQRPETDAERHARAEEQLKNEENQRMLGVLPAFNSVIGGNAEPLTAGEKFHLFFRSSIDPYQFVLAGIDSGVEQWEDVYPEYHYGIQGYARRYGAAFADNFDGNLFGNAVLPALLHQDPRYFRLGHGTILHRALYSASTSFRTRSDKGNWQPAYSNLLGNLIGGAISNAYYPAADRGIGQTLDTALTDTYTGIFGALLLEFYPDVSNHFKQGHARKLAQRAAQQNAVPVTPAP